MNNLFKKVVSSVALLAMILTLVPTASFAATISDGDLVKASGSSAVYLIQDDGKKRVFPHSSVYLSWGHPANYSTVKTVSADELSAYPDGGPVIYRDGFMFRFRGVGMVGGYDPSAVFYVSDGKIRPIESVTAYMKLFNGGVNESSAWDRVYWIPDDLLAKFTYPQGDKITASQIDLGQLPNGLVVRDTNSKYYVIKNGQLANITSDALAANRYTANANVFTKMLVTKLANSVLNLMPAGPAITGADPDLLTIKKISAQPSTTNVVLSSDKTSVEADGASYATLTALVPSTVTAVNFVITSGSGMLSAYTVTPVNGVATVRVTPSASSVSGTLTVTASATGLTSASVTLTTVANTLAPQVVSVSNQGMRIINVVFDKAVDKATATNEANYIPKNNKTSNATVYNATLLQDQKTVQLFINDIFYNDSIEDSIEIKNVQNAAQNATMSSVTKLLTVTDASVPTVVSVEALGSRAMRVTFSEAVLLNGYGFDKAYGYGNAAFRLDDKELVTGSATTSSQIGGVTITYPDAGDYTKALIEFGYGISVGAHTLNVGANSTIKDYNVISTSNAANPFYMTNAGYVATVSTDTSVPVLSSVELLTQTKARYTFSKAISTPSKSSFYWSTSANQLNGVDAVSYEKISDTVYEVSWGSNPISTGNVYFYAGKTDAAYRIVDYSGNSISPLPSSKLVNVVSDTAPRVMSVTMTTDSDKEIVVTFDKDVDETSSQNSSNYVLKTSSGVVLKTEDTGFVSSTGNPVGSLTRTASNLKEVKIANGTYSIPGGTYQLCVKDVKASSGVPTSAMSEQCVSLVVTDKTRPTLNTTDTHFASAKRIVVKYSEAMDVSALNAANYKIQYGYGFSGDSSYGSLRKLSDVSGVSTFFRNDNKDVVIEFTYDNAVSPSTVLTIGYVDRTTVYSPKDASLNLFDGGSGSTTQALTIGSTKFDNKKISIGYGYGASVGYGYGYGVSSAKITSATTLEVVFTRDIEQVSTSDFRVNAGGTWINPSSVAIDSSNKKKVVFTIPNTIGQVFKTTDANKELSLILRTDTNVSSTKDITGLLFDSYNAKTTADSGTAPIIVANDIKPALVSAVIIDENTVKLSFDGKIDYTQANLMNLAKDLNLTVNGVTYTGYGVGYGVAGVVPTTEEKFVVGYGAGYSAIDTANVVLELGKPTTLNASVIVRTVSVDAIRSFGANGAKIASNTTGVTAATFAVSTVSYGYGADVGYKTAGASYGYGVALSFTRTFKPASISTDSSFDVSTGYGDLTSRSVSYNSSTGKLTINGVGEISGFTYGTSTSYNSSRYVYDVANNKLYVYFMNNTDGLMNEMYTNTNLVFTPVSALQSTSDTGISTTFLTEVKQ